ncbi:hypothetical protein [Lysinibacillus capsici]|uniref:hypothetical protein n=1 Tax=Lysinibacillus capsici TaxID=2115968 RepID=UPI000E202D3C|nr:hypothetical protein [Lysinibacillus capsici]RDV27747.1 hypothetical protein C7B89_19385 [Lysinibacillus capsici]
MQELTIVYRNRYIMKYIQKKVSEVSHIITDTCKLEGRIYSQLASYYATGKRGYKHSCWLVNREIKLAMNQYRKQNVVPFDLLAVNKNDYGESFEFQPIDALASVEESVIELSSLNERIRSLAATDSENFVLNAWIDKKSDSDIAKELALHFGGNSRSLRIWVQRFRTKCQDRLEKECVANNLLIKHA